MAKPVPVPARPRLLVTELWGVGDVALAVPFLRAAAGHADVTILAKPHAAPVLRRFAAGVAHVPLVAPWTAFRGKYHLHRWPWRALRRAVSSLRRAGFDIGVSARPDPRDHVLLALAGARRRLGPPRAGSQALLTEPLPPPVDPHRAAHWRALASRLGFEIADPARRTRHSPSRRILIHTGAGQPVRRWPPERYLRLAERLRATGREVDVIGDEVTNLDSLIDRLATADAFIGNDSGPGHLAALLGVPTFTIFGPQLPKLFHPIHPQAEWIEGAPCPYKPCFDACRFAEPRCILGVSAEVVVEQVEEWLIRPMNHLAAR